MSHQKHRKCLKSEKCPAFKAVTSIDCGQIWFKQIALAQFFGPLQDQINFSGIGPLKNAENALKVPKIIFVHHLRLVLWLWTYLVQTNCVSSVFLLIYMMKIFFWGVEHLKNVENDYKVRKMFFL